jgi:2-methylisocitrate lyase-like PEP mutase family enzyme
MASSQSDKATRFRALHQGPAFVIPNPWDAGSARILTSLGFQALATSSGASAGILGRRDGKVLREEALAHARAEGFLRGKPDLDDVIKRLQAFEKAGADVLMSPGLPDLESVRKVCAALSKPFNFMVGIKGKSFTVAELTDAGVKRISLATSLYRMAMTGLVDAAREVKDKGTFGYIDRSLATPDMNAFMQG